MIEYNERCPQGPILQTEEQYHFPVSVAERLREYDPDAQALTESYEALRRYNDEIGGRNLIVKRRVTQLGREIWQKVLEATK